MTAEVDDGVTSEYELFSVSNIGSGPVQSRAVNDLLTQHIHTALAEGWNDTLRQRLHSGQDRLQNLEM